MLFQGRQNLGTHLLMPWRENSPRSFIFLNSTSLVYCKSTNIYQGILCVGTVFALIGSLRVWGGRDARDVFAKNHGKENCVNLGKKLVLLGGEGFTR